MGAQLEKNPSICIEKPNVHGTVPKPKAVNFASRPRLSGLLAQFI